MHSTTIFDHISDLNTQEILDYARDGNSVAWEVIYRRYRVALLLAIRAKMGRSGSSHHDTEDVLQSSFLSVWGRIQAFEYRGEGSFRNWLRQIVVNKAYDRLRMRARETSISLEDSEEAASSVIFQNGPSQDLLKEEEKNRLLVCLSELPNEEQEILVMRKFEKKTWPEIAKIMKRSESTVRLKYKSAWQGLVRLMTSNGRGRPNS